MPDMDGPKTLAALQCIDPAVVCCFMTGYAGEHTPESLLGLGAVRLFDKPFRIDEMAQALWQIIRLRAGGRVIAAGPKHPAVVRRGLQVRLGEPGWN